MKSFASPVQALEILTQRYATKSFDPSKPLGADVERALVESLRLAPSSYGLQPWKFIIVRDAAIRSKLRAASWNQSQVEDAPFYVVLAAKESVDEAYVGKFVDFTEKLRGLPAGSLDGYRAMMVGGVAKWKSDAEQLEWAKRQTYIAMGFFGFAASAMGIDACMLEGLDPKAYDAILGLEGTGYATVAAIAAGYRSGSDAYAGAAKSRFPVETVVETR